MIRRGQSPDDQLVKLTEEADDTQYIEDACRIYGLNFAKIEGIGLVSNLDGTGSDPIPSGQREHLIEELKSRGVEDPIKLLASKNSSLVVLRGLLPPGLKKGERYDVEVKTLPKSETQSLEHGYLVETRMRPMAQLGRSVKQGHVTGYCKGGVLVDALFETRQDQPNQVRGWIFGGGVATEDRPLGLTMKTDHSVRTTSSIARAINNRFTVVDESGRHGIATAKSDSIVQLEVPDAYRNNIGRFMHVIMNIAYDEPDSKRVNRMDLLDQQISNPALARVSALRLEALGDEGVPALKRALRHHHSEVKFNAAQALCYMGEPDGIEIMEEMAKTEPSYRWHALTALSSMDDLEAGSALTNLMHVDSAETRYGAFRAMRARSPQDPLVKGKAMDDFYFHVVPTTGPPMLHLARSQRPELVCFGADQTVTDDFMYVVTGLTIKSNGDGTVRIVRYARDGEQRKVCSTKIPEIVEAMSAVGCDYSTMVKMFRESKQAGKLNTRLVVNAVPKIGGGIPADESEEMAQEQSEKHIVGPLPELFRTGDISDKPARRAEMRLAGESNESKMGDPNQTRWSKIKGWFSNGKEEIQ
jgi:flagellar basal body P-ring protein FlgI